MSQDCCNECDNLGIAVGPKGDTGATGPTGPQGPAGSGGVSTLLLGSQNIFVSKSGVDASGTNSDLTKSYLLPSAAITKASTLTPSAINVINILVYPGSYTDNFTIPQYVNLIAITPNELIYNGVSYSTIATKSANALRPVYVNGTITVASDNVKIVGVNCNTLAFNTTGTNCTLSNFVASTAITTNTNTTSNWYDVHSPLFLSTTGNTGGYFEKCTFSDYSISSGNATEGGNTSAIIIDCIGTNYCISSSLAVNAGNFTGELKNFKCTLGCVSSSLTGNGGTVSGTIKNFSATSGSSIGYSTVTKGTLSGTLQDTTISEALGLSQVTVTGFLNRCRIRATQASAAGVTVGANARVRYCDIKPGAGGVSVNAAGALSIAMVHSNLYGGGTNNVTNLVSTPYVTDDLTDVF